VECVPFSEFQKRWIFQTERGIEYRYLAYKREGASLVEIAVGLYTPASATS